MSTSSRSFPLQTGAEVTQAVLASLQKSFEEQALERLGQISELPEPLLACNRNATYSNILLTYLELSQFSWTLDETAATCARRVISVSRLDRDTSGLLVAATCAAGADALTDQFKAHQVFKRYLALCTGRVEADGRVEAKLFISGFAERYRAYVSPKGKWSLTDYEVLLRARRAPESCDELSRALGRYGQQEEWYTLLACYPRTGRTHQIRAHLQFRGAEMEIEAALVRTSAGERRQLQPPGTSPAAVCAFLSLFEACFSDLVPATLPALRADVLGRP